MSYRFGTAIRELRIHLCQTSKHSEGVRNFIQKYYVNLKKENPGFPILIRECSGVQPRIWARYGKGCEKCHSLKDMNAEQILSLVRGLAR
ncbi:NADH dehydrogenase [ubiquinone] 1 alpha subcomplex subunit 2 isoform X2 [Spodoptera frugiperda]|uniref:NADH dehydrogenase [ubiquinone] 1 alpha subcomplex subunit 2 n=1 Tax=Spodoptera frugiperda TaxID=7108 RepID=A0A9R0CUS1_SPOFR|nr:NADH dehydrogenase [ubiquinone] 1 alpha subcomplex subunit 2 isoform X2 [Spodoptera frugiperda]